MDIARHVVKTPGVGFFLGNGVDDVARVNPNVA